MRDEPYRFCPKELCREKKWGKGKVKRLLGVGAGLIFKGSGFYITDYRSDSYKEAAKKEAPAATASSASGSGKDNAAGKSDAKGAPATTPAKTAEAKPKKEST
jgi:predicted nucleic acid-binding Zn ribbon protein